MPTKNYEVLKGNVLEIHKNGAVYQRQLTPKQAQAYRNSIGKVSKSKTKEVRSGIAKTKKRKETEKKRAKMKKSFEKGLYKLQPSLPKKKRQGRKLSRKHSITL